MNREGADTAAYRAARAFVPRVCGFARIRGGVESPAYSFRSRSNEYLLRVNREANGFEKDAFAYNHFARRALPIPEIVRMGRIGDGQFYCISRRLPGRTLEDLRVCELTATLEPTWEAMQAIAESPVHSIRGFGPFDSQGNTHFATWREFLLSATKRLNADSGLVQMVQNLIGFCPETRRLVHADFGSNNVLTDGHAITGVLDWSEAMIGDPLYDVANILIWRGWLNCMEALAGYLEKQIHPVPNWRERVLCYQACIALRELGDPITAGWTG